MLKAGEANPKRQLRELQEVRDRTGQQSSESLRQKQTVLEGPQLTVAHCHGTCFINLDVYGSCLLGHVKASSGEADDTNYVGDIEHHRQTKSEKHLQYFC